MATLHLLCGSSALDRMRMAKDMERDLAALCLSPQQWMDRIPGDGSDEKRLAIEAIQWQIAARALQLGLNVLIDDRFETKSDRDVYTSRAASLGAQTRVHSATVSCRHFSRCGELQSPSIDEFW